MLSLSLSRIALSLCSRRRPSLSLLLLRPSLSLERRHLSYPSLSPSSPSFSSYICRMDYLTPIHTSHGTTLEKKGGSKRIQKFKAEFMRDADGYFRIDLCDNSEKLFCEKLSNFSILDHNNVYQDDRLQLDEVVSAMALDMNGKYMVELIYYAIALDDQQKKIAFESHVEYEIIDGEEERVEVIVFTERDLLHGSHSTPIVFLPDRTMTHQQWDRYEYQIKQSDGFDVEYTPAETWSGQIAPINLSIKDEKDKCEKLAVFATDDYYHRFQGSKGKLCYVELRKAMRQNLDGKYYYLTFMATKDGKDMRPRTCQAIVHVNFDGNTKVPFCRLETSNYVRDSLELLWDDRGHA